MKHALYISGAFAALAMASPSLVAVAFLLIVPGLVLAMAPTFFVYLAATACIRAALPWKSPVASVAVAFAIAMGLGWAVMQPFRANAIADYESVVEPEIIPDEPIVLDGAIRFERRAWADAVECDYLCAAILESSKVRSLTVVGETNRKDGKDPTTRAFAIVNSQVHPAPGLLPVEPGLILRRDVDRRHGIPHQDRRRAEKAVAAAWAIRLSGKERMIEAQPVAHDAADWTIRMVESRSRGERELRQVEIVDSEGVVHFRKQFVEHFVPTSLFYFGFHPNLSPGGLGNSKFSIGQEALSVGDRYLELDRCLLGAIRCSPTALDLEAIQRLRAAVERAIENPNATQAELSLAKAYLGQFFYDTPKQDHRLIARIVADERVPDIGDSLQHAFHEKKVPAVMRSAYAERILMPKTDDVLRYRLAKGLANMPKGTFTEPDASHWRIWTTTSLFRHAGPFLERLADVDSQQAMPVLRSAFEEALMIETYRDRRPVLNGIREGLIRMGPDAADLAPRIREVFLRRPSPIMCSAGEADRWRFTLARMGVAIDDLPFFPSQSPASVAKGKRKAATLLAKYDAEQR